MKEEQFRAWIINHLRRASYRWRARSEVQKKSRVSRGMYTCNSCKKVYSKKETQVDHVVPVIDPVKGFTTFDEFIRRLFVPASGWQILCKPCHKIKTDKENKKRKKKKK